MKFLDYITINPKISLKKGKIYPFIEMSSVGTSTRQPEVIGFKEFGSGAKFQDGDTVIARITPCLQNGKKFYCKNINKGFGSTEYMVFRPKDESVDSLFLYYFMQTEFIKKNMINSMTGATGRQRVNADVFNDLEVKIPPIDKQKNIGGILSTYDDLIENNQKQIKLLEEVAQRLYKEWFVDFRFPGYEKIKFIDGIPEGWKICRISELGKVITGKTPSTRKEQNYGKDVPFIKIPDMHNLIFPIKTEVSLSEEGANTQKNKYIPKNSLMVSCIATVGLVNISFKECQTNQQINSIVLNKEIDLYYMYYTMRSLKTLLEGVGSSGATIKNVNKTKFENLEVLYPTNELRIYYFNYCKPIFEKILTLSLSIDKLSQARDILLPKLMNGEIEV